MSEHVWSASEVVAQQINRLRRKAGLNREQLAEKIQALAPGKSLSAAAIGNIETGRRDKDGKRRREVTVDEVMIFAKVLGVPPLLLVYPLNEERAHEVLPGREMPVWPAAKWFTGEAPLATQMPDGRWAVHTDEFDQWQQGGVPVDLRRTHDWLVKNWNIAKGKAAENRRDAETAATADQREAALREVDVWENYAREVEQELRHVRREMPRHGLTPPEMNELLRHVDEEPGR